MEKLITWIVIALVLFAGARFVKHLKERKKPSMKTLFLDNGDKALKFHASIYPVNLSKNILNVGIVRDKDITKEGKYHFLVELSDHQIVSGFNDQYSELIEVGDLIYWGFIEKVNEKNIINISAIGHILAILNCEFDPSTKKWTIQKDLTQ